MSESTPPIPPAAKLAAILQLCQLLGSERNLQSLLVTIAREATRLVDAERASIFLLDRERNEIWSQVALDSDPIRFDAELGIAGHVASTGKTFRVDDARESALFFPGVDASGGFTTRSLLAVPLRDFRGEVIGAFEILNHHNDRFDESDEEIVKALAPLVASAIQNVQLMDQLRASRERLRAENKQLRHEVERRYGATNIVGASAKIRDILALIDQIRDTSVDVLITGESGTGKELFARAIHYESARSEGPFVALNCAALPESLLESELFGIEKGVATGVDKKLGRFEEANGGTLFLDEIGDLALSAQAKILRALQERVIQRVGSGRTASIDVRIVAATHKDLDTAIREGQFRQDLFYRLRVVRIETPALREIREDIPLLANRLLELACSEMHKEPKQLTPRALRALVDYGWPGNVRQLENEVRRVVAVCPRRLIDLQDLDAEIQQPATAAGSRRPLREAVQELEKRMIREALETHDGNQARSARALGLSRQGLIKKIKRYELAT